MALPWAPLYLLEWGMICCLDELWCQVYGIICKSTSNDVFVFCTRSGGRCCFSIGRETLTDEVMALPWAPFCLSKWGMICCLDEGEEQELWHQVYGISLEHMSTGVFGLWPYAGVFIMCLVLP